MHIRINRVKRPNKTYRYVQLVESYRRKKDGMPATKVIANLGDLKEAEVENLRAALEASRQGRQVVVESATPERVELLRPFANLQFLDVAVLLETWREWGLTELLDRLMPIGQALVRPADVVAALAIHRCVGPLRDRRCSKADATEWFAKSALPELLHISPARFNNSRLHRVLEQLEQAAPELMEALPRKYVDQEGAFTTLYADLTDALFVGQGPELAVKGRTKKGHIQRRVGIALLCNRAGYPLRWDVVAGNVAEQPVLTDLYKAIAAKRWAWEVPVICDRIMGATANIRDLLRTDVHFMTALRRPEFATYGEGVPWKAFEDVPQDPDEEAEQVAAGIAEAAGFERVNDSLFVLDLGIVEPTRILREEAPAESDDRGRAALELVFAAEELREAREVTSYNAAARRLGITPAMLKKYRKLLKLCPQVQDKILSGKAKSLTLAALISLGKVKDAQEQQQQFEQLCQGAAGKPLDRRGQQLKLPETVRVRAVAYFNPQQAVAQRQRVAERRRKIEGWLEKLNQDLSKPTSRLTRDKIVAKVDRRLRKDKMLDSYETHITATDGTFEVDLTPVEKEFQRRYRYAGFTILVGHPQLGKPAAELPLLYRAKDEAIEKPFRAIKSVVTLEPVRHHTDPKVRAHVAICMLALLLERTLRQKLNGQWTAPRALSLLRPCNLHQYQAQAEGLPPTYRRTHVKPEQRRILTTLGLERLLDEDELTIQIRPRQSL